MTAQAKITEADMRRAFKTVKAAGIERAQIVMDLAKQQIIVNIGEPEESGASEWSDEDV